MRPKRTDNKFLSRLNEKETDLEVETGLVLFEPISGVLKRILSMGFVSAGEYIFLKFSAKIDRFRAWAWRRLVKKKSFKKILAITLRRTSRRRRRTHFTLSFAFNFDEKRRRPSRIYKRGVCFKRQNSPRSV